MNLVFVLFLLLFIYFNLFFVELHLSIAAPNRRPGNVSWKTDGSWVTVRWDHVRAMHNESAVLGYKVSTD